MLVSLVCINVTKIFFCHVFFFPAVFSAGRQTCLVVWMSFMPLDRFAARLKKWLEKKLRLKKNCVTFMQTRDMYLHFTRSNVWANGNRYNFSSRVKTRLFPMLFNGRALIFTFSRTQVRIAEIERLQSLFKMSMDAVKPETRTTRDNGHLRGQPIGHPDFPECNASSEDKTHRSQVPLHARKSTGWRRHQVGVLQYCRQGG